MLFGYDTIKRTRISSLARVSGADRVNKLPSGLSLSLTGNATGFKPLVRSLCVFFKLSISCTSVTLRLILDHNASIYLSDVVFTTRCPELVSGHLAVPEAANIEIFTQTRWNSRGEEVEAAVERLFCSAD